MITTIDAFDQCIVSVREAVVTALAEQRQVDVTFTRGIRETTKPSDDVDSYIIGKELFFSVHVHSDDPAEVMES